MQHCRMGSGVRTRRDGAVDSAVIREEVSEAGGAPRARAATSGEEVKESTLEYLKRWVAWAGAEHSGSTAPMG